MRNLLQQQHKLKRSKFISDFIIFAHIYILDPMGTSMVMSFFEENKIVTLLGLSIVFYIFSIRIFIVLRFCLDRQEAINKKLIEVEEFLSLLRLRYPVLHWQKIRYSQAINNTSPD